MLPNGSIIKEREMGIYSFVKNLVDACIKPYNLVVALVTIIVLYLDSSCLNSFIVVLM